MLKSSRFWHLFFYAPKQKVTSNNEVFYKNREKKKKAIYFGIYAVTYRRKMEENAAYPSKHEKTDKKYCSKSGV